MPDRAVRCRYLETTQRGSTDRCNDEATDPLGEVLLCQRHLAAALEMAGRLPGITITLAGGDGP